MKIFRGTGRELATLPIDGQQCLISTGHPTLIPKIEIKCSKSVTSTQGAQPIAGLAAFSRISGRIRQDDSLFCEERQYEMPLLFRRMHAITLFVACYNFCKVHSTTGTTPAHGAGLTDRPWTVEELLTAATI